MPLDVFEYHYEIIKVSVFSPAMYLPLLFTTFQAIEIDIRDQLGLYFKRVYSKRKMDRYDEYFGIQLGGGGRVGRIYIGASHQRGHGGIGRFLARVFRRVLPFLSRGAKVVGKEALRAGANIVSDIAKRNTSISESFRTRVKESGQALKRKAEEKLDKLMEVI